MPVSASRTAVPQNARAVVPGRESLQSPARMPDGPVGSWQLHQRAFGNQALQRSLLSMRAIVPRHLRKCTVRAERWHERQIGLMQMKLAINQPGDIFEQEADRAANDVMRMAVPTSSGFISPARESRPVPREVQRSCSCGGTCQGCREKEVVVRRATSRSVASAGTAPSIVHEVLRSSGQPLDSATRAFMEPRFGADFSGVRVHTDTRAAESARAVNALAYTVGTHIVFSSGSRPAGAVTANRLLAHELAHVVQQSPSLSASRLVGNCVTDSPRWLMRTPHESGIKSRDYSFSTNCGWIDWGHAKPGMAKNLIDQVHAASERLKTKEAAQNVPPGEHLVGRTEPGVGIVSDCPSHYEPGEKGASANVIEPSVERQAAANFTEFRLYGFQVDKSDASRFAPAVNEITRELKANPKLRMAIYGFSDCIGSERNNVRLRAERAIAILRQMPVDIQGRIPVATFAPIDRGLASNATREERRRNRSVLVRLLPPLSPERVAAAQTSAIPHLPRAGVNAGGVAADILQPLTHDQELAVALAIFVDVSIIFENSQFATDFVVSSAFSEEDLPSDLIGFYVAARGLSRPDVEKACDAWDTSRSLAKFKGYTFQKNPSFMPLRLEPGGAWPTIFSNITPEDPGALWEFRALSIRVPGATQTACFKDGNPVSCSQAGP